MINRRDFMVYPAASNAVFSDVQKLDRPAEQHVSAIVVSNLGQNTVTLTLQGSEDGTTWTTLSTITSKARTSRAYNVALTGGMDRWRVSGYSARDNVSASPRDEVKITIVDILGDVGGL